MLHLASNLKIYASTCQLSFNSVLLLPFNTFVSDWYGNKLSFVHSFCLAQDKTDLYYLVKSNAPYQLKPETNFNEFVEGLWEYSACELFIYDNSAKSYFEINLSPNGAWWCCDLIDYRVRNSVQNRVNKKEVEIYTGFENNDWLVGIKLPKKYLPESYALNACAILGSAEYYLASRSDPNLEPDFHNTSLFLNL